MTTTIPDVPVPPGARPDTWQDNARSHTGSCSATSTLSTAGTLTM